MSRRAAIAVTVLLGTVGSVLVFKRDAVPNPSWQVIRDPGTPRCAVVPYDPSLRSDPDYREEIGRYPSREAADAALREFQSTPDGMTTPGHTICQ